MSGDGHNAEGVSSTDNSLLGNHMPGAVAGGGRISGRAGLTRASNEVVIIDLAAEDEEEPSPHQRTTNIKGLTGPFSSPIQSHPSFKAFQGILQQMARKIQTEYETKTTEDQEKIRRLENLVHMLRATVLNYTSENNELGRKLKAEKDKVSSLKNGIAMMEEHIREVNLFFGGMASRLKRSVEEAAELDCGQPPFPVTNQDEITIAEVKMEPAYTNYVDEADPIDYYVVEEQLPGSSKAVTFRAEDEVEDNESVPVVCDMIIVEPPRSPSPSAFFRYSNTSKYPHRCRKTRKLLHKYKKVRQPPPTGNAPNSYKSGGIRKERKNTEKGPNLKDDRLASLVYGRKRDRSLFGLRPSSVPRRKLVDRDCSQHLKEDRQIYPQKVTGENAENVEHPVNPVNPVPPKRQRPRLCRNSDAALNSTHAVDVTRTTEGAYFCSCGLSCTSNITLTRHVRYFGKEWKFACDDCGRRFFSTQNLRNHLLKIHGIILPASTRGCTKCGGIFKCYQDYAYHLRFQQCY